MQPANPTAAPPVVPAVLLASLPRNVPSPWQPTHSRQGASRLRRCLPPLPIYSPPTSSDPPPAPKSRHHLSPPSRHSTSEMRHGKMLLLLALCLCGAGARAQTAATTTAAATALPSDATLTAAVRAALGGVPDQGGVTAMLKVGEEPRVPQNAPVGLALCWAPGWALPPLSTPRPLPRAARQLPGVATDLPASLPPPCAGRNGQCSGSHGTCQGRPQLPARLSG